MFSNQQSPAVTRPTALGRALAARNLECEALPPTLTVEETAVLLRIGRGSAYEAVRRGQIPSLRIGRRLVVPRARLLAMLGQNEEPS
jgi:excisionase family DNA binding protein